MSTQCAGRQSGNELPHQADGGALAFSGVVKPNRGWLGPDELTTMSGVVFPEVGNGVCVPRMSLATV